MAPVPTYIHAFYEDDAGRLSEVSYRFKPSLEDDGSNIAAVLAARTAFEVALNVVTMDRIDHTELRIQLGGGGAAPNDAASNGEYAFARTNLSADSNEKRSFIVPAWDTALYEESANGLLDATAITNFTTLLTWITDPDTGADLDMQFVQARQRKVFKRNVG
jgi:hypothetical protein